MTTLPKDCSKDPKLVSPPSDTISDLSFSPTANFLSVASWDKSVRIYEIKPDGTSVGLATYNHDAPVLCNMFSPDGTKVASGGGDNIVKVFDPASNTNKSVGKHDAPISCISWVSPQQQILISGSWDKTVKYWDLRQANSIGSINMPDRIYAMDSLFPLLAVGLANQELAFINLEMPFEIVKKMESSIKFPIRDVAAFHNPGFGAVIATAEGRCSIQHIDEKLKHNAKDANFTFKAHRDKSKVYPVNRVTFNPTRTCMATGGGEGVFSLWDKENRVRLGNYKVSPCASITAIEFNGNSSIFAYAVGYDWSQGYKGHTKNGPFYVGLHAMTKDDLERPKK